MSSRTEAPQIVIHNASVKLYASSVLLAPICVPPIPRTIRVSATKAQTRPPPLHVRSARSGEPHLGLAAARESASWRASRGALDAMRPRLWNALRADRGCARGRLGTRGLGWSRKVGNASVLRSGRAGEKERRRKKAGGRRIGPEFVFLRVSFGPAARRSRIGRAHLLLLWPVDGES